MAVDLENKSFKQGDQKTPTDASKTRGPLDTMQRDKRMGMPRTKNAQEKLMELHLALLKEFNNRGIDDYKVTATKYADKWNVNERTVRNYLENLRHDPYNLPLAEKFNSKIGSWQYQVKPTKFLNPPPKYSHVDGSPIYSTADTTFTDGEFNHDELIALLVSKQILDNFKGVSYADELKAVFDRLTLRLLKDTDFLDNLTIGDLVSVAPSGAGVVNASVFKAITHGLIYRRKVKIKYLGKKSTEEKERVIHPYHLSLINNQWQMIAFCESRKTFLNFTLSRVQQGAQLLTIKFVRDVKFSPIDYLGGSLGPMSGQNYQVIKLRISRPGAHFVRERNWHGSQKIKELSGGSIEVEFRLNSLDDVERWVLGFGSDCVVLEPKELAERIKKEAEKMVRN
jgi:predicted DNA-binding transcriptional regulator YafY